jgi:xylulose-5-phosphate/fructose-6-phosphate phosphoketolase
MAEPVSEARLSADELRLLDAYWRAANYLSVGQIYLLDNPLLTEPLEEQHVKPRLRRDGSSTTPRAVKVPWP